MENPGSTKAIRVTSPPPLCNAFEKPEKKGIDEHRRRQ